MDQLKEHTQRVMERWRQEVSRLPFPAHYKVLDGDVLKTMEELTAALFGSLEDEGVRKEFEPFGKYYRYGEDLGRLRNQGDFTMQELVQEHLIYRNEFWGYFRETVAMKHMVDYQLEKEINSCFDAILQASAKAYQSEFSREIRENPLRDPLTGLYNADYFKGRLIEETRRSVRYDHELSLILFEMENYFDIQETEGGERLKEMMRFVAEHLGRLCRDCDVIARVSDGGFALLLPETGLRGGRIVAERLSHYLLLELPAMTSGEDAPVLRWGLASYPSEVADPEKLYDCAKEAMIQARFEAPDEVVVYRPLASPGG